MLNDQKCSNLSSESLKLSVDVSNFNLNQFSDLLEGLLSKTAHCGWVRVSKGIERILELFFLTLYSTVNTSLVVGGISQSSALWHTSYGSCDTFLVA